MIAVSTLLFFSIVSLRQVFMDVAYYDPVKSQEITKRIIIELFDKDVPKTCDNFYSFIKGCRVNGQNLSYKNSIFHRIIDGFMIQGGDILNGNGTGSISSYGKPFEDENFKYKHHQPGMLSMANSGPDTNGSQFFITTAVTKWLDDKHVVFGQIINNTLQNVLDISKVPTDERHRPIKSVVIKDCGDFCGRGKEEGVIVRKYFFAIWY
ncbi:Peptidyl-prolyl cis-trans isomerase [Trachipleistophora hominis]|uniref:Peptidyl-prolyl cis-trans isomerase n=1 Tax=Trachipleistophora hominis TaxID=72359 RepID=L7JTE7_TRAHO|nr:Peptidyl-prolyl cis-trans isomerase [Trachipleistophora hominis]